MKPEPIKYLEDLIAVSDVDKPLTALYLAAREVVKTRDRVAEDAEKTIYQAYQEVNASVEELLKVIDELEKVA